MRAEHHHLVPKIGIRPGNLGDDVVSVGIVLVVCGLHIDAELDVDTAPHHSHEHVVVLAGNHDRGDGIVGGLPASQHEHRPMGALARPELNCGAHFLKQRGQLAASN